MKYEEEEKFPQGSITTLGEMIRKNEAVKLNCGLKTMAAQELCLSRSDASALGEQSPGMGPQQLRWSDFNACETPPQLLVLINHTVASAQASCEQLPIFC